MVDVSRRGFLGQVIGFIAATQLPFRAVEAIYKQPTGKLELAIARLRIFHDPVSRLKKYRIYAVTDKEVKFWAPGIKEIKRDLDKLECVFAAEDLQPTDILTFKGMGLVDPQNRLVGERNFSYPVPTVMGDIVKITYTLNVEVMGCL